MIHVEHFKILDTDFKTCTTESLFWQKQGHHTRGISFCLLGHPHFAANLKMSLTALGGWSGASRDSEPSIISQQGPFPFMHTDCPPVAPLPSCPSLIFLSTKVFYPLLLYLYSPSPLPTLTCCPSCIFSSHSFVYTVFSSLFCHFFSPTGHSYVSQSLSHRSHHQLSLHVCLQHTYTQFMKCT